MTVGMKNATIAEIGHSNQVKCMSVRNKLKGILPEDVPIDIPVDDTRAWYCGEIPLTWAPTEIKRLRKQTIRGNYLRGIIDKETYKEMLK